MRPVSTGAEERLSVAPVWKVVAVFGLCLCLIAYGAWGGPSGRSGWAVGVGIAAAGVALYTVSVARTLRENAGRRLQWLASPNGPRRFDLIAAVGYSATVAGAGLLGRLVEHEMLGFVVAAVVLIVLTAGPALAHNYRIRGR